MSHTSQRLKLRPPVRQPIALPQLALTLLALLLTIGGMGAPLARAADPAPTIDQIEVTQRIVVVPLEGSRAEPAAEAEAPTELVPGQRAILRFSFKNTSAQPVRLAAISQLIWGELPPALAEERSEPPPWATFPLAPGASASFERPVQSRDTQVLSSELSIDPQEIYFISRLTYCFAGEQRGCPDPGANPTIAAVDELRVPIRRSDLGDAPDSTNHAAAPMTAYPTVPPTLANYPTVFDPATGVPSGPLHRSPQPFHLGQRVSLEAGADIGPDQDPRNNIVPLADNPDNDRYDDGIRPNQLGFVNCRPGTFQAGVFINPVFKNNLTAAGIQQAYINVWVDSNRDGDWEDASQCPQLEGQPTAAVEHIVIDQPISIAALNAGVNIVPVATGRVAWPDDQRERPSWLRITLSLAKSTKTLSSGGIEYGDGRGNYSATGQPVAFRSGETEDYLINRGSRGEGQADLEIRKWGRIIAPQADQPNRFRVAWVIEYRNIGDAPAREVVVRDRLRGGFNINNLISRYESRPNLTQRPAGDTLNFNVGLLEPGGSGRIAFVTTLPLTATPGLTIENVASISAANDSNAENNQAVAQAKLRLPRPIILSPGSGATCAGEVTVGGIALNAQSVDLYVDGVLTTSAQVGDKYRWEANLTLTDGSHEVVAVAKRGEISSEGSNSITILVDTSLPYDPLSMRFTAQGNERGLRPVNAEGVTSDGGWVVPLRANTTYSFTVRSCCDASDAELLLKIGSQPTIVLTDPDGDTIYTGNFTTGETDQTVPFTLIVVCAGERHTSSGVIRTFTLGKVFDAQTREPLAGVEVTLFACDSEEVCQPATDVGTNPQTTGDNGAYDFVVPAGDYVIQAVKEGYYTFRSRIVTVVDQPFRLPIVLRPLLDDEPTHRVAIDEGGFESTALRVRPGAIIEFINVDVWEHAIISPRDPASGQASGKLAEEASLDSGALAPGESFSLRFTGATSGTTTYTISDGEDGFNSLTVIVDAAAPPTESGYLVRLPMVRR